MSAREIIDIYISFFEKRGHKRISNSPLVPENDPTTLFTSSGMQPLVPYLLGEPHPEGLRLVNVQNCFRAVDIDEVGDNRHTTFFRMLGNWSLGDPASPGEEAGLGGYFKAEEIPWLWEFLTVALGLPKDKLYITVFEGDENFKVIKNDKHQPLTPDVESYFIWAKTLDIETDEEEKKKRITYCDSDKNWWSRSGIPEKMPVGEPGGPDTEVYYKFDDLKHEEDCRGDNPALCECGVYLEIANAVFMQYRKVDERTFEELPNKNVDFGGGLERILAAVEDKSDIFQTSLFSSMIRIIEVETEKKYSDNFSAMRIIADHLTAASFLIANGITPSKNEQGYILRRLLRRCFDKFNELGGDNIESVLGKIIEQYKPTDEYLVNKFEVIKNTILEERQNYGKTISRAEKIISVQQNISGKAFILKEISAQDAFKMYTSHGLSPVQIKSLGYVFDDQKFAQLMEEHQKISRAGSGQKFAGGLADTSEQTIRGHTATHLLHKAIRDLLGDQVHQSGSNITADRVRFDFNYDRTLTEDEIKQLEQTVNEKIEENLPVFFEFMPLSRAKEIGAIGLFDEKYSDKVKVYLIGNKDPQLAYSKEFCGGPHVSFTSGVKSFKIIKQENIGRGLRRLYALVG